MNTVIYNLETSALDLSVEPYALRVGIILSNSAFSVGAGPFLIDYENIMKEANLKTKMHLLTEQYQKESTWKEIEEAYRVYKLLCKKKGIRKEDILFKKKVENYINNSYAELIQHRLKNLNAFGWTQLNELITDIEAEERPLSLFYVNPKAGEEYEKFPISRLFRALPEEGYDKALDQIDVFFLFDALEEEAAKHTELMPIATMPNLNALTPTQLLGVRHQLKDTAAELNKQLIPIQEEDPNSPYVSGKWKKEGLDQVAKQLQTKIEEITELNWAATTDADGQTTIYVGTLPTPVLWQIFKKHNLIPPDTIKVLEECEKKGEGYGPFTPIITVSKPEALKGKPKKISEYIQTHKRKTINLD